MRDHRERGGASSSVWPMSRIIGAGASGTFNKGGREWVIRAKGGQPEKSPGSEGGGALMVTGPEPVIGMSVWWGEPELEQKGLQWKRPRCRSLERLCWVAVHLGDREPSFRVSRTS